MAINRSEHKLIQSYVLEKFFVSTAYRRASTVEEMWFYETIVWDWDSATHKRGKIVTMEDSGGLAETAIDSHFEICRNLAKLSVNK